MFLKLISQGPVGELPETYLLTSKKNKLAIYFVLLLKHYFKKIKKSKSIRQLNSKISVNLQNLIITLDVFYRVYRVFMLYKPESNEKHNEELINMHGRCIRHWYPHWAQYWKILKKSLVIKSRIYQSKQIQKIILLSPILGLIFLKFIRKSYNIFKRFREKLVVFRLKSFKISSEKLKKIFKQFARDLETFRKFLNRKFLNEEKPSRFLDVKDLGFYIYTLSIFLRYYTKYFLKNVLKYLFFYLAIIQFARTHKDYHRITLDFLQCYLILRYHRAMTGLWYVKLTANTVVHLFYYPLIYLVIPVIHLYKWIFDAKINLFLKYLVCTLLPFSILQYFILFYKFMNIYVRFFAIGQVALFTTLRYILNITNIFKIYDGNFVHLKTVILNNINKNFPDIIPYLNKQKQLIDETINLFNKHKTQFWEIHGTKTRSEFWTEVIKTKFFKYIVATLIFLITAKPEKIPNTVLTIYKIIINMLEKYQGEQTQTPKTILHVYKEIIKKYYKN